MCILKFAICCCKLLMVIINLLSLEICILCLCSGALCLLFMFLNFFLFGIMLSFFFFHLYSVTTSLEVSTVNFGNDQIFSDLDAQLQYGAAVVTTVRLWERLTILGASLYKSNGLYSCTPYCSCRRNRSAWPVGS
jgi:hypothetical protein